MSLRSIILGLLLGAFISGVTYYNDFVLRQPSLINHLLPVSVLGTLIILTLLVNPLLGARGMIRRFKRGELAMIVAMGLAACTWPGAGFFRTAVTNLAMPAYFYKTDAAWQSQQVMAYLPGGSARLAPGHIRDWQLLLDRLAKGESGEPGLAHQLWQVMPPEDQLALQRILDNRSLNTERRHVLLGLLNRAMGGGRLVGVPTAQQMRGEDLRELNHRLLAEAWPETLSPPPRGWPLLPTRGDETDDAFLDALIAPAPDRSIGLSDLPWTRWGPVLGLWGGLALTLGLASLCLALIVHPQWSRRELLSYPIPRFVSEMTRRDRGHGLPDIAYQRGFWIAFAMMAVLHLINGLHHWFEQLPHIPLNLDFNPLRELFPIAGTIPDATAYFWPAIFPAVIAFTFFLNRAVSLSVGIAPLLYVILAAAWAASGAKLENDYLGAGGGNLMRFGAYLAAGILIAYSGRHYYRQVVGTALGISAAEPAGRGIKWAARGFIAACLVAIILLHQAGLGWFLSAMCVGLILLMFLVLARIAAETGMFFIQPYWMPVGVLTALLGAPALGPTAYIILAMTSVMIVGDTRTALLPNLIHALKITDSSCSRNATRPTPWLLLMIIGGFVIAAAATLLTVYHHGIFQTDLFTREELPRMPFDHLARLTAELSAQGQLADAVHRNGRMIPDRIDLDPQILGWLFAGALLFLLTALARLRLPGWPFHPVIFLIWGTFPSARFAFSFLLGWGIKTAVIHLGGTRAFNSVMPFMVGILAGELASAIAWWLFGAAYTSITGQPTPNYSVLL